jgi:FAD/FMN-containing dehydrogenase
MPGLAGQPAKVQTRLVLPFFSAGRDDPPIATLIDDQLDLQASLRGQVIDPAHPDFDLARGVFNGAIARRPALIVRPLDAADVVTAIEFARAAELPLSVRGGGHNVAGHAVCEGGLMLDLRLLRGVKVDETSRVAEAGGGATWNDFDPVCQRHGLATPGGTFGTTGIAGLTLGGGIGHLNGRYGLTLDNLLQAEVVTADGQILVASEEAFPDLFWALRGGGGNFGVVTRFFYGLHEVGSLTAGLLVYDFAHASAVIRSFRDLVEETPDELTLFLILTHDRGSGDSVVVVSVCWTGDSEDARGRLESLRSTPGLLVDAVRPTSYLQLQAIFGEMPFGLRHYWKGHFIKALPDELIEFVVEHFARRRSPLGSVLIEPLQGQARRVPDEATAFANRHAAFNMSGMSIWESPDDDDEQIAWARAFGDGVGPYSSRGGGYLNYMGADEPLERVQAAFGAEKFARLGEVKREFDPDNVFRQNQNIPPAV